VLASADRLEDKLEEAKGLAEGVSRKITTTSFAMRRTSYFGRATGPVAGPAAVEALEGPGASMVSSIPTPYGSLTNVAK